MKLASWKRIVFIRLYVKKFYIWNFTQLIVRRTQNDMMWEFGVDQTYSHWVINKLFSVKNLLSYKCFCCFTRVNHEGALDPVTVVLLASVGRTKYSTGVKQTYQLKSFASWRRSSFVLIMTYFFANCAWWYHNITCINRCTTNGE